MEYLVSANCMALLFAALYYGVVSRSFDRVSGDGVTFYRLLYLCSLFLPVFIMVNLYDVFNLLPIPPLDGSSIIGFLLPSKYLPQYYKVQLDMLAPYIFGCDICFAIFLPHGYCG